MNDEVISPELVLVDPELAQIARRRLPDAPEWRPQPLPPVPSAPLTLPVSRRVAGRHPTIGVRALAAATMLLLLGPLVVPNMGGALLQHPAAPVVPTKFEVEARTLALLQGREGRSAPAGVLDQRSGLLATSAYIVCARVGRMSVFDCRLGVGHSPGRTWLLTVAVAADGTEKLTWNGSVAVP